MRKKNVGEDVQKLIQYAFERCGEECVLTFEAESAWRYDAKNTKNRNGTYDISYCQLNSQYHKKFIHSQEFKNKQNVLNYCIDVYNRAREGRRLRTTFYAYNVIHKEPGVKDRFEYFYR